MSDSLNSRFGLTVRRLREERRWSQERLAEHADLNRSYLGEIERGIATPSLLTAAKLASAFELGLGSLLNRCETPFDGHGMLRGEGAPARLRPDLS